MPVTEFSLLKSLNSVGYTYLEGSQSLSCLLFCQYFCTRKLITKLESHAQVHILSKFNTDRVLTLQFSRVIFKWDPLISA
jgi:hypothetical protein